MADAILRRLDFRGIRYFPYKNAGIAQQERYPHFLCDRKFFWNLLSHKTHVEQSTIFLCYGSFFCILRNISLVIGPAAKRFQSSAIGKFLSTVPTQIAGNCDTEAPPRTRLNNTLAAALMVGHIIKTVQQEIIIVIK